MFRFYYLISLIINPVVTFGAALILSILLSFSSWYEKFFWLTLLFSICFMVPGLFYGELLIHGRIDADVKNKKRRAGLFIVTTIVFSVSYAISLFLSNAPIIMSALLASVIINVIYSIAIIHFKYELSVHIGGITFLVIFLGLQISSWYFLIGAFFILLLAKSRYALRMHTISELVLGFLTSVAAYFAVLNFV